MSHSRSQMKVVAPLKKRNHNALDSDSAESSHTKQPRTYAETAMSQSERNGPPFGSFPSSSKSMKGSPFSSSSASLIDWAAWDEAQGTSSGRGSSASNAVPLSSALAPFPTSVEPSRESFKATPAHDAETTAPAWKVQDAPGERGSQTPGENQVSSTSPKTAVDADLQKYDVKQLFLQCPRCQNRLLRASDILARVKDCLQSQCYLTPFWKCNICRHQFCAGGCGKSLTAIKLQSSKAFKVGGCCTGGRLYLLWALLAGVDGCFKDELRAAPPGAPPAPSPAAPPSSISRRLRSSVKKATPTAAADPQVSQGPSTSSSSGSSPKKKTGLTRGLKQRSALARGIGYGDENATFGGGWISGSRSKVSATRQTVFKLSSDDDLLLLILQAVPLLLPSTDRAAPDEFDLNPDPLLPLMVARSPLLRQTAEFLRYYSLEDMASRAVMYGAVLDFLEALGSHGSLFFLLSSEHAGQSFTALFQKLQAPCARYVEMAASSNSDDLGDTLVVCKRVCAFSNMLKAASASQPPPSGLEDANAAREPAGICWSLRSREAQHLRDEAREWFCSQKIAPVQDDKLFRGFRYEGLAAQFRHAGAVPDRARTKKLLAQIADLHSSLPDGIFVRYSEGTIGAMKVLIVGPAGTPYEHGLFEFDLWCPAAFPKEPPKMHFRTTGWGAAHFNPNLYPDGKVCLSLLGTWHGQTWDPAQSTLLQILVSIQAMIFNDEPWYNEPGRERVKDAAHSETFNVEIQDLTMRHALTYWLRCRLAQPPAPNPANPSKSQGKQPVKVNPKAKAVLPDNGAPKVKAQAGAAPIAKPPVLPGEKAPAAPIAIPKLSGVLSGKLPPKFAPHAVPSLAGAPPPKPLGHWYPEGWTAFASTAYIPVAGPPGTSNAAYAPQTPKGAPADAKSYMPLAKLKTLKKAADHMLSTSTQGVANALKNGLTDFSKHKVVPPEYLGIPPQDFTGLSAFPGMGQSAIANAQKLFEEAMMNGSWAHSPSFPIAGPPFLSHMVAPTQRLGELSHTISENGDDFIWGEIIRKHFQINAAAIQDTTSSWKLKCRTGTLNNAYTALGEAMTALGFFWDGQENSKAKMSKRSGAV